MEELQRTMTPNDVARVEQSTYLINSKKTHIVILEFENPIFIKIIIFTLMFNFNNYVWSH